MRETTNQIFLTRAASTRWRRDAKRFPISQVPPLQRTRLWLLVGKRAVLSRGFIFVGVLSLWVLCAGCASRRNGVGVLPPPPPDQIKFSNYQPQSPFAEVSPGVSSRTLFVADEETSTRVEVRDVLVSPRKNPVAMAVPGADVFEVRSGSGGAASHL